mgnify:CR=1 FL=1
MRFFCFCCASAFASSRSFADGGVVVSRRLVVHRLFCGLSNDDSTPQLRVTGPQDLLLLFHPEGGGIRGSLFFLPNVFLQVFDLVAGLPPGLQRPA